MISETEDGLDNSPTKHSANHVNEPSYDTRGIAIVTSKQCCTPPGTRQYDQSFTVNPPGDGTASKAVSSVFARSMTEEQLHAYQVEEAVKKTEKLASTLWGILSSLLSADDEINVNVDNADCDADMDIEDEIDNVDEDTFPDDSDDEPEDGVDQAMERQQKLMNICAYEKLEPAL
ncbi:hypothetical protein BDN71DRAFT_1431525 [Pleurotus eryngii]|uniref:Uncharacterized protein n=1 Tax=Pleurotus eryngii TaxID=5323 RepID=A0A9P5ZW39_PLEER|nr:hypothetical protein BDN71DRAFT_1431525 [Pleurotus eryngii]